MKFLALLLSLLIGCTTVRPKTMDQFQETAVMIHSMQGGGGSGVIYKSTFNGTLILTNRHICESIETGGFVVTDDSYLIKAYKKSQKHDVCGILIKQNLFINTVLASEAPARNTKAFISGHPSLYPHIVSEGYVSGIETYPVRWNDRACNKEEKKADPVRCILDGTYDTREFESQVVSALISPGSSGSAVFNSNGEIIGLAFASQGDLGYALTVPWKFVNEFVYEEADTLKWERPDPTKTRVRYENDGIYSLDNWQEILKLINGRNQCLRLCQ